MFRSIHPRQQAAAIEAFVQAQGVKPKHADVLELVARLNGASHYNALVASNGSGRPDALTKRIKGWLAARFERFLPVIEAWHPGSREPQGRALVEALAGLMHEAGSSGATERESNRLIAEALTEARRVLGEFEDLAYKAAGFNREFAAPQGHKLVSVRASLVDEDGQGYEFLVNGDPVVLAFGDDEDGDALLERVLERSALAEAIVHYPRADRYGVPHEATHDGARDWAWAQGFAVTPDFEGSAEDSRDDSPAWVDLGLWLHPEDIEALSARMAR